MTSRNQGSILSRDKRENWNLVKYYRLGNGIGSPLSFSPRSRRLEVVGARENERARGRYACLLLALPFFLAPTTSKACYAGYLPFRPSYFPPRFFFSYLALHPSSRVTLKRGQRASTEARVEGCLFQSFQDHCFHTNRARRSLNQEMNQWFRKGEFFI